MFIRKHGKLTRTVDELPMLRIVLLVRYDEREQGDRLARTRRHFQYAVTASIERS